MDWFWQQTTSVERSGCSAKLFKPEAQLLHLSFHLYHHINHHDFDLLRFYDIALLIATYPINWQEVLQAASMLQMVLPLQKLLPQFVKEWNAPIPPDVIEQLSQMHVSRRERRKFGQNRSTAAAFITNVLSLPTWKKRLRYARGILFPPLDYMKEYYKMRSPILLPFYYVHRWLSRSSQF
jgi:hypothetical protein